jgi:hypothetical protein
MWVRGAAIRPVPRWAVIDRDRLRTIERQLANDSEETRAELDGAFERFEQRQPSLADRMSTLLGRPLDQTALALGYFLSIAVWLAFERSFGERMTEVSAESIRATEDALALEEELRAQHAEEPLDLDDVMSIEQPGILAFIHEHVEAALEGSSRAESGEEREVDVDDVHLVYRAILVQTLALSHAVEPAKGMESQRAELQA